jgi:hypothetical protein
MHGTAMLHIDTICIWGDSDDTTLAQITHWARHATERAQGGPTAARGCRSHRCPRWVHRP